MEVDATGFKLNYSQASCTMDDFSRTISHLFKWNIVHRPCSIVHVGGAGGSNEHF